MLPEPDGLVVTVPLDELLVVVPEEAGRVRVVVPVCLVPTPVLDPRVVDPL